MVSERRVEGSSVEALGCGKPVLLYSRPVVIYLVDDRRTPDTVLDCQKEPQLGKLGCRHFHQ